jgi:hypothetical protein
MIIDHGPGKRLLVGVAPFLRDPAGLNFEHVTDGNLPHEIFRLQSDAEGGVDAGLLQARRGA